MEYIETWVIPKDDVKIYESFLMDPIEKAMAFGDMRKPLIKQEFADGKSMVIYLESTEFVPGKDNRPFLSRELHDENGIGLTNECDMFDWNGDAILFGEWTTNYEGDEYTLNIVKGT